MENKLISQTSEKKLGIVGGMGPETSCNFCLNLNKKIKKITGKQPDILLANLPVSSQLEESIVKGKETKEMFELIKRAVIILNKENVDFITIPCNSVHIFIDKIREISKKPVISIIEECARECKNNHFKKVGLLASSTTVKNKLHENQLKQESIEIILPDDKNQKILDKIILNILNNKSTSGDNKELQNLVKKLEQNGAEAVILGCTDLRITRNSNLKLIDSLEILENSTIKSLLNYN